MGQLSHAELLREYLDALSQPGAESRLPQWTDWMKLRRGAPMALGAALALFGCGGEVDQRNQDGQGGVSSAGGTTTVGNKYGVVMGGSPATGGFRSVPIYGVFMNRGGASNTCAAGGSGAGQAGTGECIPI